MLRAHTSVISLLSLVTLFLSLFVSPSSASSPSLSIPSEFVFASLLPLSHEDPVQRQIAQQAKVILDLAVQDVNGGRVSLPSPIRLIHTDASNKESSLQMMWSLYHHEPNLLAYIGGFDNLLVTPQSLLSTVVDKIYFTAYGRSPYLADVTSFPTVIIQTCTSHALGYYVARQLLLSRWYRFALITTMDDDAQAFQTVVMNYINVSSVTSDGLTVDISPYQIPDYAQSNTSTASNYYLNPDGTYYIESADVQFDLPSIIDQALDDIIAAGIWVVVVHGTQTPEIVYRAYLRGLLRPPYVFVIDSCSQVMERFKGISGDPLTGMVCVEVAEPGDEAVSFHQRLMTASPTAFPVDSRLTYEHVAIYNSVLAFAHGLRKQMVYNSTNQAVALTRPLTGANNFETVTGLNETGVLPTYPLVYQSDGEVRVDVGIYNYDPDTHSFLMKIATDIKTGASRTFGEVIWPDGTTHLPKDRPRVYVDGDALLFTKDSKTSIIGFIVASLGAWTSLILMEQALAFRHRKGFIVRCIVWTVLSSIGFSVGCVWPIIFFQFNGYTVDYTSLAYDEMALIPTAFILFAVILCAYFLCLYAVPAESATDRKAAAARTHKKQLRARGAPVSGGTVQSHDRRADPHAPGRKHHAEDSVNSHTGHSSNTHTKDASENSESNSSASSYSQSLKAKLQRIRKACDGDISNMAHAFSWHIVLAALLIDVIILIQWMIVCQHLIMSARFTFKVSSFVAAFFFMFFFIILSLLIYFHATIGDIRPLAPFLIAGVITAGSQLALHGSVFTLDSSKYGTSASGTNQLNADSYCTLMLIAICVCITFVLMAVNISALKISKNALDKVVDKLTLQIMTLERTMHEEKDKCDAIKQEGLFFRRTLECINLCRPVFRNYAVALAMADPDEDQIKQALKEQEMAKKRATQILFSNMSGVVSGSNNNSQNKQARPSMMKSHKANEVSASSKPPQFRLLVTQNSERAIQTQPVDSAAEQADSVSVSQKEKQNIAPVANVSTNPHQLPGRALLAAAGTGHVTGQLTLQGGGLHQGAGAVAEPVVSLAKLMRTGDIARLHCPKQEKQLLKLLSELAVMDPADMSRPVNAAAVSAIKLPQLLSHPLTIELMKDVLNKQLSPENMAFWLDIQKYRSIENAQTRRNIGDEIYHLYICDGARYEVNLSSSMKESISNKMNRSSDGNSPVNSSSSMSADYAISLFDDAEKEIFKLMQTNNYETFVNSPFFKLAAVALEHPDYKLKHASSVYTVKMQHTIAIAKKNAELIAAMAASIQKNKDSKAGNNNSGSGTNSVNTVNVNNRRNTNSVVSTNQNNGANSRRNTNNIVSVTTKENADGPSILKTANATNNASNAKAIRSYASHSRTNSGPVQMFTTTTIAAAAAATSTSTVSTGPVSARKAVVKLNVDTSKVSPAPMPITSTDSTTTANQSSVDLPGVPANTDPATTTTPTINAIMSNSDLPQPPSGRLVELRERGSSMSLLRQPSLSHN